MTNFINITVLLAFWCSVLLCIYTYFLYPFLLFGLYSAFQIKRDLKYLMNRSERRASSITGNLPFVSILIPAYNEAKHLEETLVNATCLDYRKERLEIIVASDGSTDDTNDILVRQTNYGIKSLLFSPRQGKASTLNRAVPHAAGDILILSDATTQLAPDAVIKLVRHFIDPQVGVVCGSLRFVRSAESQQTEGMYWKYESALRLMEGRLGATLTASGALYAIRRECYRPLPSDALLDDFLVPMMARRLGYKVLYDPEAIATEFAASGVSEEALRRTRLALGSFRALPQLLSSKLPPITLFAFVSHKLLRWIFPFMLIAMFLADGWLAIALRGFPGSVYRIIFAAQIAFYLWACLGAFFRGLMQRVPYGLTGYFLIAMNVAFLKGFYRYLRSERAGTWERAN